MALSCTTLSPVVERASLYQKSGHPTLAKVFTMCTSPYPVPLFVRMGVVLVNTLPVMVNGAEPLFAQLCDALRRTSWAMDADAVFVVVSPPPPISSLPSPVRLPAEMATLFAIIR